MARYRPYSRRFSDRYERRARSFGRQSAAHRGRVARILYKGLQDATQELLYDRTPLPVTRDMFRSIRTKLKGVVVQVGYFYGKGARYAKYRVNMTGRSRRGGHKLDMQPSRHLRDHCDAKIKRSARQALQEMLKTK